MLAWKIAHLIRSEQLLTWHLGQQVQQSVVEPEQAKEKSSALYSGTESEHQSKQPLKWHLVLQDLKLEQQSVVEPGGLLA